MHTNISLNLLRKVLSKMLRGKESFTNNFFTFGKNLD